MTRFEAPPGQELFDSAERLSAAAVSAEGAAHEPLAGKRRDRVTTRACH